MTFKLNFIDLCALSCGTSNKAIILPVGGKSQIKISKAGIIFRASIGVESSWLIPLYRICFSPISAMGFSASIIL